MSTDAFVWERIPASKEGQKPQGVYRGQFMSEADAREWVKRQVHKDWFFVTDLGPMGVVMRHRKDPISVDADADLSFAYETVKGYFDNPDSRGYLRREAPVEQSKQSRGNKTSRTPARGLLRSRPAIPAETVTPPVPKSAEELALAADAAKELAKAKKDESREVTSI